MEKEKESVRLGGMALQNGVLVHGPKAWGCAVRDEEGNLRVASGLKPSFSSRVRTPVLRGPARLAEAFALLPVVRRALPQARYPFERPAILGSIVASSVAVRAIRRNDLLSPGASEMAAAAASLVPALVALRGPDLAAYHGAEHVSIGTYETGEPAPKEHPRCGSQLIAPMVASTMLANAAVATLPRGARRIGRLVGAVVAVGASVELSAWSTRNPERTLSRVLSRPGLELQRRYSTAEPSAAQLEVANAARDACLALEA